MAKEANKKESIKPEIREITVGIKEPRTITIYPLSMQDQFDLIDTLQGTINEIAQSYNFDDLKNEEALAFLQTVITKNLSMVLEYVTTDKERPTFSELTNNQFFEIVNIVFEVNYEGVIKNSKDLFQKITKMLKK